MPRATDTAEAPRILSKLISPISGDSISIFLPSTDSVARIPLRSASNFSGCTSSARSIPKLIFDPFTASSTRRPIRIVAAHDRDRVCAVAARQYLGEQPQLGREVVFHGRVIVEMVAAEVGEHARAETERIDAPFRDSNRRHFRRRVTHALALHLRQRRFEIDRLRRRQSAVDFLAPDENSNRADNSRRHPGRLEDRREDIAGRGLAAGAGDADQIDALARRAEKTRRGRAHQQARPLALHQDHRGARRSTHTTSNHHSARPAV